MPNNEDEWIDEVLERFRIYDYKTWSEKEQKYLKTYRNKRKIERAKATIKAKLLEARLETAEHIKNICPVTDEAAAERLHNRIGTYVRQLQASAPTKKGEDRA